MSDPDVLSSSAEAAGLDGRAMLEAIAAQEIKDSLRRARDAAWQAGVRGVPSVRVAGEVCFGDDPLEAAA